LTAVATVAPGVPRAITGRIVSRSWSPWWWPPKGCPWPICGMR